MAVVGAAPLIFDVMGDTETALVEAEVEVDVEFELGLKVANVVDFELLGLLPLLASGDVASLAAAVLASVAVAVDGVVGPSRLCTRSAHRSATAILMQKQSHRMRRIFDLMA
jgi:hypothetical protein